MHLARLPSSPSPHAFALAAIGLVCASAGAALLAIGQHIFDEIEISERWQSRPGVGEGSDLPMAGGFNPGLPPPFPDR